MAVNFRLSKLSEKEDECIFTWKLFSGWDYMIGNAETSDNRTSSIVLGFKEALLEEAEKKKEKRRLVCEKEKKEKEKASIHKPTKELKNFEYEYLSHNYLRFLFFSPGIFRIFRNSVWIYSSLFSFLCVC